MISVSRTIVHNFVKRQECISLRAHRHTHSFQKLKDTRADLNEQLEHFRSVALDKAWHTRDDCITGHHSKSLDITLSSILSSRCRHERDYNHDGKFQPGDALPVGYFMIYATPLSQSRELGLDGFDNYLAPLVNPTDDVNANDDTTASLEPFLRRMWVSGEINYYDPLTPVVFGKDLSLEEKITDLDLKKTRQGLPNYKMRYQRVFSQGKVPLVEEKRVFYYLSSVYSDPKRSDHSLYTPDTNESYVNKNDREVCITEEDNFRISALTFNAHKIHYDKLYATQVENYPNVVVSAPLLILLSTKYTLDRGFHSETIRSIRYNLLYPVFIDETVRICYTKISDRSVYAWIEKDNIDSRKLICFESIIEWS